jgi:hypothetical protein
VQLDISKQSLIYHFKLTVEDGEIFIDIRNLAKYSEWAENILKESESGSSTSIHTEKRPCTIETWKTAVAWYEHDFHIADISSPRGELIYLMDYLKYSKNDIGLVIDNIIRVPRIIDDKFSMIPAKYAKEFIRDAYSISTDGIPVINNHVMSVLKACNLTKEAMLHLTKDLWFMYSPAADLNDDPFCLPPLERKLPLPPPPPGPTLSMFPYSESIASSPFAVFQSTASGQKSSIFPPVPLQQIQQATLFAPVQPAAAVESIPPLEAVPSIKAAQKPILVRAPIMQAQMQKAKA